jgi:STE24 endopeptidase
MNKILIIILIILTFDFVLERILAALNKAKRKKPLPIELEGVYNEETYKKSICYKNDCDRLGLITSSIAFIISFSMFVFKGFAYVDNFSRHYFESPILLALLFFGILILLSDIISTPLDLYSTFVIEERYGFNKTTWKTYLTDKLKGYMLTVIIGGGLLAFFIWFYQKTGNYFWIYVWVVYSGFMIFMLMFYSNVIVPLFNKQRTLEEGELRKAILAFSQKAGFQVKNVYVIDGSKRSTKANAYFTGLGPKKRIVLFDTLIKQLSVNEIVAVLAHEIGHYKKKHTLIGLTNGIIQTGVTLFLLSLFLNKPALKEALSVYKPAVHIGLITFGILYSPISMIVGLVMNYFSRKNEYAADNYTGSFCLTDDLINSLKKLSVNNLSDITPHPIYVIFHYSHPTLLQRIKALKNIVVD